MSRVRRQSRVRKTGSGRERESALEFEIECQNTFPVRRSDSFAQGTSISLCPRVLHPKYVLLLRALVQDGSTQTSEKVQARRRFERRGCQARVTIENKMQTSTR